MPTPRTLRERDLHLTHDLPLSSGARTEVKRIDHALVEGSAKPDCLRQSNPKDHQSMQMVRGREIAARKLAAEAARPYAERLDKF